MFAQGFDKVDDSGKLSALTGAYANLGAHREGVHVFFRVLAPFADEVSLVGSFNGWADGARLERTSGGVWQGIVSACEITDGDRYKFKARIGDEEVFLSDPYAVENDGEPYFNSIYRECAPKNRVAYFGGPLNAYEIVADRWFCYDGCREVDYSTLSRELLPYLLQMGYTHVYLSGKCNEGQGGEDGFAKLADAMHAADIGVLVGEDFGLTDNSSVDGVVLSAADTECFGGLVHKICFEGSDRAIYLRDPSAYHTCFSRASADKQIRRNAAAMTYLLFKEGRMLTRMGCETGRDERVEVFDLHTFESAERANFQRFCSELASIYLSNPEISVGSAIAESDSYGVRVTARHAEELDMILVTDLRGNGGRATIPARGEWRVILDSSQLLGYESAIVSSNNNKSICIALPSYGAVLLERIR